MIRATRDAMRRRSAIALSAIVATCVPVVAAAQGTVTIAAGSTPSAQVAPGAKLTVPVTLDMSAANGGSVGSFSVNFVWDAASLTFDSLKALSFGTVSPNLTGVSAGVASFSVVSGTATTASVPVANMFFTASGVPVGTHFAVTPTAASNPVGAIALWQVLGRGQEVCVTPVGTWGDADGNGAVDIIDAMQIARSAVGLSVANPDAVGAHGDVNADGVVDVLDAQAIARFVVDLTAPPRVGTSQAVPPTVASMAMSRPIFSMTVEQTSALFVTPKNAAGESLIGCPPIVWTTSDATKLRVNQSGKITSLAPGVVTITATSGSVMAQSVVTVTAPDATSALLRLRNITAGGTTAFVDGAWMLGGLLTDEWKSSDTFVQRIGIDQRVVPDNDNIVQSMLREIYRARSEARGALPALLASGGSATTIAQMYFVQGYAELLLAESFCNGVPLTDGASGLLVGGPAVTTASLFARAIAHFDSALAVAPAASVAEYSTRVSKARALLGMGQFSAAAAAVATVPTPFIDLSTLGAGENNKIWTLNASQKRWTVGDNVDPAGAIGNALNFASAADPRLPVNGTTLGTSPAGKGSDLTTNLVVQLVYGQLAATPLFNGTDARLIEAEAQLNAGNLAGMTAILNALRASALMPVLPTPANQAAGIDLFFREKAFFTFSRGQRLGDLRRMVRYFGRTDATAFPTGTFFKGGTYGTTNNFPASVDEEGNLVTTVCIDRNP